METGGTSGPDAATPWSEAVLAAALYAVDPTGLGGIALRSRAGPVRDQWLALVQSLLPPDAPFRKIPLQVSDGRLLGGLDLAATLQAGRPIAERGLLAACDGGTVVLPSAERRDALIVARLGAVMDRGAVAVERDGFASVTASQFGVIALDEATEDDEQPPAALLDRLAFHISLDGIGYRDADDIPDLAADVALARSALRTTRATDRVMEALCSTSLALGVASLRAPVLAVKVAQAHAALCGRTDTDNEDAAVAARFVLGPRASMFPVDETEPEQPEQAEPPPPEPETPPDGNGLSLPGMSASLSALMKQMSLSPSLAVGHSAGAAILMRMVLDGGIAPKLLISLNGALLPLQGFAGQFFSPLAKLVVLNPFTPRLFAWRANDQGAVERVLRGTGSQLDDAGVDLYRRLFRTPAHVSGTLGMMARWDLEPLKRDMPRLKTPLLLVACGADQAIAPDTAFKVRDLVPGATVEYLRGLGHLAHEEQPEAFAKLMTDAAAAQHIFDRDAVGAGSAS